jgi:hypothetical protein
MPDKRGAQFQDHPNVIGGRAALPRPLAVFAAYEFAMQCPTPTCRFRRVPVAPIAAARPALTVADALARLRCRDCGARPEIVALSRPSLNAGEEFLVIRCEATRWKPMR